MVFDDNDTDVLSPESYEKESLIAYFATLIKNQNNGKDDFYEIY